MTLVSPLTAFSYNSPSKEESKKSLPKVYMVKEISPESLLRIYEALGREATGKVAVKISTGEPGGNNYLKPALIGDLVKKVNGTIVECNTAYGGGRANTTAHLQAAKDHGFTAIAEIDIMDAEGETALPVKGGKHLKEDFVGSHFLNYDFTIILRTSRDTRWVASVARSKICRSASLPRQEKHGFIAPERQKTTRGATCPNKTISWNPWLKPPKPSPTIVAKRFSISA